MTKHKPNLPRKGKTPTVKVTQHVPEDLYKRMIAEGKLNPDDEPGLVWGTITKFINDAIQEKLDRQNHQTTKEGE